MRWKNKAGLRKLAALLAAVFIPSPEILADYSDLVELSQNSGLACGKRLRNSEVLPIDLRESLDNKIEAVASVARRSPEHGLESPVPLLIETAHADGEVRRSELLRNAVRESALRGCGLVIVLNIETVEKVMFRPQLMDLKLPVSYILVPFGSQVRNSARVNE